MTRRRMALVGGFAFAIAAGGTTLGVAVQQADAGSGDSTGLGRQPVAWVGGHATAIYTTSSQPAFQGVTLVAWSGDAVIQVSYQVNTSPRGGQTPPPRSTGLSIVTGIAHAAFAALPHGAALLTEKHPSR